MHWSPSGGLDNPALLLPFLVSGIGLCIAAAVAALAWFAGPKHIFALAGAVLAAALLPFPLNLAAGSQSVFAAWICALLVLACPSLFALYQLLQLRADGQGYGAPRLIPIIAISLCGAWLLGGVAMNAAAISFGAAALSTVVPAALGVGAILKQRKRRRIENPNPLALASYATLVAGGLMPAIGMTGILPGELTEALFVIAAASAPAMLAATTLSGAGKATAVTSNRILRLTAKSLEDENRQLSDMAARLEFERNRLQQRRVELEKENKQAEDRIKELCETADAFFTLGQSIDYARRIQQALIPSEMKLRQTMGDAFILNLPRDKVSGDFLWCIKFDDGWSMLCVADCTGHGVPGAFMSALGTMLLGQIVTERTIRRPDQVLFSMDKNLRSALSSNGGDIQDGMEAGIMLLSPNRNQVIFSGAKLGLCRANNGECTRYEGVRRPIGGRQMDNPPAFESTTITLRKGETLYLFSDGFQDQLGGPSSRRYLSGRFKDTLAWISALPINEQRAALLSSHNQWRAGRDQTDDIMVVGVKV
jgi:serine phosphatase RsbU (regulator of sigma subunit)